MAEDYSPDLLLICTAVLEEMTERLTVELSERDLTAVGTAVQKAAGRALRHVLVAHGAQVTELSPETDVWNEIYGDGASVD